MSLQAPVGTQADTYVPMLYNRNMIYFTLHTVTMQLSMYICIYVCMHACIGPQCEASPGFYNGEAIVLTAVNMPVY